MVEVVQDLLDTVTYPGGVGRRRVDAIHGIGVGTLGPGFADCAVLAEDPSDPKGPRIVRMQDLMFYEMLDKPFEEKAYHNQLAEFAYRGENILAQVDKKLGEIEQSMSHDVLARSKQLPVFLGLVNDELRHAHGLVRRELEEVWRMRFEPFFFPAGEVDVESRMRGWLDLDDMFLTSRLLTRHTAELAQLIGIVVRELPPEALDDRSRLIAARPSPELCSLVTSFVERVPWLCASMASEAQQHDADALLQAARADEEPLAASGRPLHAALDHGQPGTSPTTSLPLGEAITSLDRVLTVHMKNLDSDLHRTMYQTFVRLCAAYARWKRAFASERALALQQQQRSLSSPELRRAMVTWRLRPSDGGKIKREPKALGATRRSSSYGASGAESSLEGPDTAPTPSSSSLLPAMDEEEEPDTFGMD